MALFMKIDGITGSAAEAGHTGWISIHSAQFGIGRSISQHAGGGANREAGLPSVSEVTVSKTMDNASIELFGWSVAKLDAKTIKIDFVTTGDSDPFVTYELTNAVISGYSVSSGGEMPSESLSFSFTKISSKYVKISADMKSKTPVNKYFDITTQQAG